MTQNAYKDQFKNLNISLNSLTFVPEEFIAERSEELNGRPTTFARESARKFFTNKWLVVAFSVFVIIVLLSIIVPAASPYKFNINVSQQIFNTKGYDGTLVGRDLIYLPARFPGILSGSEIKNLSNENFNLYWKLGLIDKVYNYPPDGSNAHGGSQWTAPLWKVSLNLYNSSLLKNHYFILGTTSLGSDRWTDLWDSAAFSLKLAFSATICQFAFGMFLGAISGYYAGKAFDTVTQRIVDIIGGLPIMIWYILIVGMFKDMGFVPVFVALVMTGWIGPTWITRMFVIKYKDAEFIKAADTYGASTLRKVVFHMLPNVSGRLAAAFVQRIPYIIYAEASFAILGIGLSKLSPGLGTMIANGRGTYLEHPIDMNAPIILIIVLVLSLQVMAIGIRDILDPKISTGRA